MPLVPQRPVHPSASPAEAMSAGYFAQVRYLLQTGGPASADTREPSGGRTPLILCALVQDSKWAVSLARLLLEKGARVGLKDRRGMNALHYACAHGGDQLAELYLQAIDYRVNDTDCFKNTAMHYAVRGGRMGIVEALTAVLQRLQLPVSPANREGVTPLMLAYMAGRLDIARRLVEAGANADTVDAFGKATSAYEREAVERLRNAEEAAAAKAAGRKLRFDDVDGWRRYRSRLRSAPADRRCGSAVSAASTVATSATATSGATPTFKEAQRELRRTRMYQPEAAELISAASPLDRRNDPGEVFRTTPTEFFGPAARQQQLSISGIRVTPATAARRPRAQSAAPLSRPCRHCNKDDENDSSDSDRSRDSREMLSQPARRACGGRNDRATMARLFHDYEFHCSSLYRPPPRAADPTMYVHDFSARFMTPSLTDADTSGGGGGGTGSEIVGGGGRRRKEAASAGGRKGKRSGPAAAAAAMAAMVAADSVRKKSGGGAAGRISRAAFGRDE